MPVSWASVYEHLTAFMRRLLCSEIVRTIFNELPVSSTNTTASGLVRLAFQRCSAARPASSRSVRRGTHQNLCRSLLPKAIELGVTTPARMQGVFRDIEQAVADGRQYSALWPAMIGVWKRKPIQ